MDGLTCLAFVASRQSDFSQLEQLPVNRTASRQRALNPCLLTGSAAKCDRHAPTFRTNLLPPSSVLKHSQQMTAYVCKELLVTGN
jgi:hypothetical protein